MNPVIQLPQIEDELILATDDAGDELLCFEVKWRNSPVRVRYPTYGQWDDYCREVGLLLHILRAADNIEIPEDGMRPELWAELNAHIVVTTKVGKRIERIFFDYLRPEMELTDGSIIKGDKLREWMGANAPISAAVDMFCSLTTPQDMLKKNAIYRLTKIYPHLTGQPSKPIATKTGDGPPKTFEEDQSSTLISI